MTRGLPAPPPHAQCRRCPLPARDLPVGGLLLRAGGHEERGRLGKAWVKVAERELVERAKVPIPRFYILTPIPGAELFEQDQAQGRILHTDFSRYDDWDFRSPYELPQVRLGFDNKQ